MTTVSKITALLFVGTFLESLKLPAQHSAWFFKIDDLIVNASTNVWCKI